MRNKILSAVVLAVAVSALAASKIEPLNVKLGLWEVTTTITSQGAMPIPDSMLAKMTPEQRARMEERMKASSAGTTHTTVRKECLTKEKQEKNEAFTAENEKGCTVAVLTSNSSKLEMKRTCNGEGIKSEGTIQVEVLSPESVEGKTHVEMTGSNTMRINGNFTGKWIASACGQTR
jgi:hypothetical protein